MSASQAHTLPIGLIDSAGPKAGLIPFEGSGLPNSSTGERLVSEISLLMRFQSGCIARFR